MYYGVISYVLLSVNDNDTKCTLIVTVYTHVSGCHLMTLDIGDLG